MTPWLLLFAGLVVLVGGADLLVRGASGLAVRLGISPLMVGLTIVSFGTSAPEVAVSLRAVVSDRPELALGNAVGSNTFNVLFILGVSALIRPLVVDSRLVRVDVPIMIGTSLLLWLMLLDGSLGRGDGIVLLAGLAGYVGLAIRYSTREAPEVAEAIAGAVPVRPPVRIIVSAALILGGLGAAVVGAGWLVTGAVRIARSFDLSELVIGLTIVAAGTSLPEVATSVVAAVRGQRDIAVGNVIGSNIFNILAILGLAGLVAPAGLPVPPALLGFDVPVMVAATLVSLPILLTGHEIRRWEAFVMLGGYAAYLTYLIADSAGHDQLIGLTRTVLWFAGPLAAAGIAASLVATWPWRPEEGNR